MTLTQIVNLSGMSKTTVHRLLKSLVAHQYVSIDRHSEYVLGSQIVCLGAKALHTSVASTGYSIARALYDATKLTVCICTLSGFEIVYLQKIAPRITIKQDVGSTRPAYCTALGKCQLAYLPEEELDRVFTVNLAFKDVRLGIEMCESFGQRVPMMSRAREVFAATAEKYGEENFTATFKML